MDGADCAAEGSGDHRGACGAAAAAIAAIEYEAQLVSLRESNAALGERLTQSESARRELTAQMKKVLAEYEDERLQMGQQVSSLQTSLLAARSELKERLELAAAQPPPHQPAVWYLGAMLSAIFSIVLAIVFSSPMAAPLAPCVAPLPSEMRPAPVPPSLQAGGGVGLVGSVSDSPSLASTAGLEGSDVREGGARIVRETS